jgi:hypothetical protein
MRKRVFIFRVPYVYPHSRLKYFVIIDALHCNLNKITSLSLEPRRISKEKQVRDVNLIKLILLLNLSYGLPL